MSASLLLGRDALKSFGYRLTNNPEYDRVVSEIFCIDNHCDKTENIKVNPKIEANYKNRFECIMRDFYFRPKRPEIPKVRMEAALVLKDNKPVQFGPGRLGFTDKEKVQEILDDLLKRGIIRTSASEYASPIVLTRKRNGQVRMCVNYRALNIKV